VIDSDVKLSIQRPLADHLAGSKPTEAPKARHTHE